VPKKAKKTNTIFIKSIKNKNFYKFLTNYSY
jgi:hypothetical protein